MRTFYVDEIDSKMLLQNGGEKRINANRGKREGENFEEKRH